MCEFTPPPGLKIEMIPAGKSMDTMLAEGEIPAMINPYIPRPIVNGDKRVARLFPDYKDVEREYFQQTGIFPIMHVTVIKQEIVDKYPWAAVSLVEGLREGEATRLQAARQSANHAVRMGQNEYEEERKFSGPIRGFTVSVRANRKNLQTAIRYCHQQGLIKREPCPSTSCSSIPIPEDGGDVDHVEHGTRQRFWIVPGTMIFRAGAKKTQMSSAAPRNDILK